MEIAKRNPSSWRPLELSRAAGCPRGVIPLYNALVGFVRSNGLPPHSFGVDYERLAVAMDCGKSTAWRRVERAQQVGCVVVHDRGSRDGPGKKGEVALLGLVCSGETAEMVRELAKCDERVRSRHTRDKGGK